MSNLSNITVVMPVHALTENDKPYFENAIKSVENQQVTPDELLIIAPKGSETLKYLKSYDYKTLKGKVRIIENDGETDFATQFNKLVAEVKTEWLSYLQFDDEISAIWLKNVVRYIGAYPEFNIFLPIIVDDDVNGNFLSLTNEAVWAQDFCDEMGVLDNQAVLNYQNFSFDGMVIRKSVIDEFGGIKPNIKLSFMYEFLLRMTHYDSKVMTIPKIGYKHVNQRPGSLFSTYKETIPVDEAKWWLAQAKKEFYFTNYNRTITYNSESTDKA